MRAESHTLRPSWRRHVPLAVRRALDSFANALARLQHKLTARLSLRARIASSMVALVTAAGLLLATWTYLAQKRLEENVTYDLLAEEITNYEQRLRLDPGAEPLQSAQLRIYRSRDIAEVPREIARFKPGSYGPLRLNKRYVRVRVRDGEFGRLYVIYDVTTQLVEQRVAAIFLAVGLAATVFLTAWVAYGWSGQLVGPVYQLAARLSEIDPQQRHLRIARDFAGNELEPIARSIDSFLERLDGFVEREQSFTATASHELRTPLAVIQGAVELLQEQTRTQPNAAKALARIQRAVREMSEFTEALLALSREDEHDRDDTSCDVTALLSRIVEDQRSIAQNKTIALAITSRSLRVQAPDSMVAMVIGNLVRNALQHGQGQEIRCTLQERTLTVINHGAIAREHLPRLFERSFTTRPGGHGMGLYLVQRICERYHWKMELESGAAGVMAKVDF